MGQIQSCFIPHRTTMPQPHSPYARNVAYESRASSTPSRRKKSSGSGAVQPSVTADESGADAGAVPEGLLFRVYCVPS
jgi:hypothetical protein